MSTRTQSRDHRVQLSPAVIGPSPDLVRDRHRCACQPGVRASARQPRPKTDNQGARPVSLAITYRRPGDPSDILELTDIGPSSPPGPGQLQVQVSAFPIHPGDLLAISALQTIPERALSA